MAFSTTQLSRTLLTIGLVGLPLFVHGALNSQTISILPTDGCGQVLGNSLLFKLRLLLGLAMINTALFSAVFAFAPDTSFWRGIVTALALPTLTGFLGFGWINWRDHEFLTACDIFLMGSNAANWNLLAALCVLICIAVRLRPRTTAP